MIEWLCVCICVYFYVVIGLRSKRSLYWHSGHVLSHSLPHSLSLREAGRPFVPFVIRQLSGRSNFQGNRDDLGENWNWNITVTGLISNKFLACSTHTHSMFFVVELFESLAVIYVVIKFVASLPG